MNKLLLLILLFNIVKASNYICRCENIECDNIKINDCVKRVPDTVFVFDDVPYSADFINDYMFKIKSNSLNQYEKYANICNKRDQNYNCLEYYKRETDLSDKRNYNIYLYVYLILEHEYELYNTNKLIIDKSRIRSFVKDYDIYKLLQFISNTNTLNIVYDPKVYNDLKNLGFNAKTEIEYSDVIDFGNIKFPIDNCGIYLSLAIKHPDKNIRMFYDFHDGYEYITYIGNKRVLQPYGYSIKYTCFTRKYQNVNNNNKITQKLQEENQQLKDEIQNLKNRIENVANFISI
jgi:hypothetical protein